MRRWGHVVAVWVASLAACGRYRFDPLDDGGIAHIDASDAAGTTTPRTLFSHGNDTCVIRSSGGLRCWGDNTFYQLGLGNMNAIGDNEPASAGDLPVTEPVRSVATGFDHMCALFDSGATRCWGNNDTGQLGYANIVTIGDNETLAVAGPVNVGAAVTQLAADSHTCALQAGGGVHCWGDGNGGELGYGNITTIGDDEMPATVGDVPIGGAVKEIAAASGHTCALLTNGGVRCWGIPTYGRLGYGNLVRLGDDETPASVGDIDLGGPADHMSMNAWHACAIMVSGAVRCWGQNSAGNLGYGNTSDIGDNEAPATAGDVDFGGGRVVDIGTGFFHTCVLLDTGSVRCWGQAGQGQLGYGNLNDIGDDELPAAAGDVPIGGVATELAVGGRHTCVRLTTGDVRCWGEGTVGQLGTGSNLTIGDNEPASASPLVPVD